MSNTRTKGLNWLKRFSESGWLSLCLTIIAIPPVYYVIHFRMGIDWFYTAILGAIVSVAAAQIFLFPVFFLTLRALRPALFCADCPACGERALVPGMMVSEPTSDPSLYRRYQLAECRHCRRHFHRFGDGSYHEQPKNNQAARRT
jgi:hypothetical protein